MTTNEISVQNLRGNLFIIGGAGTGKTRFIKEILSELSDKNGKVTVVEPFEEYSDIKDTHEDIFICKTDEIIKSDGGFTLLKDSELSVLSDSDVVVIDEASLIQNSNPDVLEYIIRELNTKGIKVVAAFQSNRHLVSKTAATETKSGVMNGLEIQKETTIGNIRVIETSMAEGL